MEYMICQRFHSVILSYICNQKYYIISYSKKICNIIEDLKLCDNYLKLMDVSPNKIIELKDSSATVEQAANALGCKPEHIAKTMSFKTKEGPILIVCAGDAKIDNKKYKSVFGQKAKMIPANEVEELIGHLPGGVCPFAIKENVKDIKENVNNLSDVLNTFNDNIDNINELKNI